MSDIEILILYKRAVASDDFNLRTGNCSGNCASCPASRACTYLHEWKFDVGQFAYDKEQELLKLFSCYKANTTGILSSGNSEIFTLNILQLGLLHENYFTDRT